MDGKALNRLYLKDTAFQELMQKRVFNVLLIASPYEAFMMEEDGRVEEQLYLEYTSLHLSSPPRVTRVDGLAEAMAVLATKHCDLVITMPGGDVSDTIAEANIIKEAYPELPIVVLTPFSKEVSRRMQQEDLSRIDYVFSWLGNVDLLLGIVKLLEDKMNAEHDINSVGVQTIMLVEDSVRFYSSVLPVLYKYLLKQSVSFSTEALNEHEQMLRMRGRPKVVLARNYEEAEELYSRFRHNMLGVITDVSFTRGGEKDAAAGLRLTRWLKDQDPSLPVIVESSETSNGPLARELGAAFIDKNSKKLPLDVTDAMTRMFGFGDFVLRDPRTGREVKRLRSLKDMQNNIFNIPPESFLFHAQSNDISRWLYARALFPIADVLRHHRTVSLDEVPATQQLVFDCIVKYRKMKNRGVVAVFQKDRYDHYSNFARIGEGSMGGKGRGLAFIDSIIKKNPEFDDFRGIAIAVPRTVVICTDIFDEFMRVNELYPIALSDATDQQILDAFLRAKLPEAVRQDLDALCSGVFDKPLAVRSSSLLEDSHYQPFAGIYSTYMVPHSPDRVRMLRLVTDAVKGVYASVFFRESKAYMTATSNLIDQEKMAVIIQEVVGLPHGGYYYPSLSGVGRSLNYYPVGDEKPEDGVAEVAVGLGKYIVDGSRALRFSPRWPAHALQTSELKLALRDTQTRLFALESADTSQPFLTDDSFNLAELSVQQAAETGALKYMVSTYDARDGILRDTDRGEGRKVVTFNNVLRDDAWPLAPAVELMLSKGQEAMGRPVEIEFAGLIEIDRARPESKGRLYWLQIRPIVDRKARFDVDLDGIDPARIILSSHSALGHGRIEGLRKVVYVRAEAFGLRDNPLIAAEISRINAALTGGGESYVLIGPGRWGSADDALGIPVKWADISGARCIAELPVKGMQIDPSQGTHFFQNLTSLGVGYFTINPAKGDVARMERLDAMPAVYESDKVRIVEFAEPLEIGLDALKSAGVVATAPASPQTPSTPSSPSI